MKNITDAATRFSSKLEMPVYPALTPADVKKAEKTLGRKLTPAEMTMATLIRKPGKVFGAPWQPVMPRAASDPFEQEYAEAKAAARSEELRQMTPVQRTLAIVTEAREARKQKELAAKDHQAKVKHFEPLLNEIEAKLLAHRWDESYSYDDIQALWQTHKQIMSEGACPIVAQEMYAACLDTEAKKLKGRREEVGSKASALREELARLESERDALDVALSPNDRQDTTDEHDEWVAKAEQLGKASTTALAVLNDLIAKGYAVDTPERKAAGAALRANNLAVAAHNSATPSATAAAQQSAAE